MTFHFLGPDPVDDQVKRVLGRIAAGEPPKEIERTQVDVKEEPGRRGPGGVVGPGQAQNDDAARYLAEEMACFANTPGGGALILGIGDDGARLGTQLDPEWLRHRIWELTERKLTVAVREAEVDGTRLLVLSTHEAIEPVRFQGRIKWRVDDHCVEIDPTSWHSGRLERTGHDWSAQPSGHTLDDVSAVALEVARRYLAAAGDAAATDLAAASDADMLRRLHLVDGDGWLTNAGSLLFVGTPGIGIDYIRRDVAGGDSTNRVESDRALVEQVWDVDQASQVANRVIHVPEGFAHGQVRALPPRAVREAIVNGVVHRDWQAPVPTVVEHIGDILTVTSPGGFIGGVSPSNIITHPAVPRYRSLADAMATLRLAEREGIGVDRMVRDMLAMGLPEPEISEVAGPYVRIGLIGGEPDRQFLALVAELEPAAVGADVNALLVIDHLSRHGWIDVERAEPILQRPRAEAAAALAQLARTQVRGSGVVLPVAGVPKDRRDAWRLSDQVRALLGERTMRIESQDGRRAVILAWAQARGRVSSTEAADIANITVPYAGAMLRRLEQEGLLDPGRATKRGRGFYYMPANVPGGATAAECPGTPPAPEQ